MTTSHPSFHERKGNKREVTKEGAHTRESMAVTCLSASPNSSTRKRSLLFLKVTTQISASRGIGRHLLRPTKETRQKRGYVCSEGDTSAPTTPQRGTSVYVKEVGEGGGEYERERERKVATSHPVFTVRETVGACSWPPPTLLFL